MLQRISAYQSLKKRFIIIMLSLSLLVGCSSASSTSISPIPMLTFIPSPSATAPPPTPSPTPTPICPQIDPNIKFISPESNNEIANKILDFLNAGGDPDQINSYYTQFQLKTLDVLAADLNDDGLKEVIVVGALPPEFRSRGEGVIYIFGCKQKSYEIDKQFDFQNIANADIIRTEKLLADYPQQVIVLYYPITGWVSHIIAIGFMNGDWQVVFQDSEFFPELVVFDQDNDGNKEISIHSETTATQGPHRIMISTFKWDGKEYSRVSDQLMPGTTRVEYLDDAQRAFDQGDMSMAIAYYGRAAHDSTLNNFTSRGEIELNQMDLAGDYQISFALFRLATLWLSIRDFDNAESVMGDLEEQFPINKPGNEFTQATNIFREQITQNKTLKEGCAAVASFFTQNYPDINKHIGEWGVTVVAYTQIVELCPFH